MPWYLLSKLWKMLKIDKQLIIIKDHIVMSGAPRAAGKGLMVTVGVNAPVTLKISVQTLKKKKKTTQKWTNYKKESWTMTINSSCIWYSCYKYCRSIPFPIKYLSAHHYTNRFNNQIALGGPNMTLQVDEKQLNNRADNAHTCSPHTKLSESLTHAHMEERLFTQRAPSLHCV